MFVPDFYREPTYSWITELICLNPLALLTSNGEAGGAPYATHVPIILDPRLSPDVSDLVGATLWGHMNRANPHWAALAGSGGTTEVATVFTGPNAYVSPTVYEVTPAAPTWNFTAVHVHGTLDPVDCEPDTLETVLATVRAFEGRFGNAWDMAQSLSYFRRILPGVGAFRIVVSKVDGMFKLSQEQNSEVRDRVRRSFAGRESHRHREIAALMDRLD